MPYIGNNLRSNNDYKAIDDISSSFNGSLQDFALTVGGSAPVPFPKYETQLLISVGGVIQEPVTSFTISDDQIVFSAAPSAGASFFIVVLATSNDVAPLKTLTVGSRDGAKTLDLHGRKLAIVDRSGVKHSILFNLS